MIKQVDFSSTSISRARHFSLFETFLTNPASQDDDEKLPYGWTRGALSATVKSYADDEGSLDRKKLDEMAEYLEKKTKEFGHDVPKGFFNVKDSEFDITSRKERGEAGAGPAWIYIKLDKPRLSSGHYLDLIKAKEKNN